MSSAVAAHANAINVTTQQCGYLEVSAASAVESLHRTWEWPLPCAGGVPGRGDPLGPTSACAPKLECDARCAASHATLGVASSWPLRCGVRSTLTSVDGARARADGGCCGCPWRAAAPPPSEDRRARRPPPGGACGLAATAPPPTAAAGGVELNSGERRPPPSTRPAGAAACPKIATSSAVVKHGTI